MQNELHTRHLYAIVFAYYKRRSILRKDTSVYNIKVEWHDAEQQEFIAKFHSFDNGTNCTYGVGDSKAEAVINLIENAKTWELES
jgi:hypothetical protein